MCINNYKNVVINNNYFAPQNSRRHALSEMFSSPVMYKKDGRALPWQPHNSQLRNWSVMYANVGFMKQVLGLMATFHSCTPKVRLISFLSVVVLTVAKQVLLYCWSAPTSLPFSVLHVTHNACSWSSVFKLHAANGFHSCEDCRCGVSRLRRRIVWQVGISVSVGRVASTFICAL